MLGGQICNKYPRRIETGSDNSGLADSPYPDVREYYRLFHDRKAIIHPCLKTTLYRMDIGVTQLLQT